jgi:ornithine decarboxylase
LKAVSKAGSIHFTGKIVRSGMNVNVLERTIVEKIKEMGDSQEPFYLVDLEKVCEKYVQWQQLLPMIEPYYAVKCNPNPAILHTLERLGTGFDCASKDEIDRIIDMGVDPSRIIFANPAKLESHILHAKIRDVKRMTFDNEDELIKIARIFPEAEFVLRIITDDSQSLCKFSCKFGMLLKDVKSVLKLGQELNIKIVGVSFHVGSGCLDPSAFGKAMRDAATVFEWGKIYGHNMSLLDIGGGFQGLDDMKPSLRDVASHITPELYRFPPGTKFIAEPGRYFSAKSHTIIVRIHSRRVIRDEYGSPVKVLYYVNDGVYQSFNCIFFDHQTPAPIVVPDESREGQLEGPMYPSTLFGPTCDSLDCLCKDSPLPLLEVGQWFYFENMGSYTTAAATRFNGFAGAVTCHYMWGQRFLDSFDIMTGDLPIPETNKGALPSFIPVTSDDGLVVSC